MITVRNAGIDMIQTAINVLDIIICGDNKTIDVKNNVQWELLEDQHQIGEDSTCKQQPPITPAMLTIEFVNCVMQIVCGASSLPAIVIIVRITQPY